MSESASPVKTPAKGKKARASAGKAPKHAPSHPTYAQMVKMSVQNLKEPKGSSKAAILKYILSNYKVGDNIKQINAHLRLAINRGVKSGLLKQVKGHGASGSFRLGEAAKKPAAAPRKRPAAHKKKPAAAPKAAKLKKPAAKPKKAKSPAKAKKATSPKKPKSPKKKASPAKKAPAKKTSPKKKAAKK